jgi:hypothetical protein
MPAKVNNQYVDHGDFHALLISSSRSSVVCDCIIDSDILPSIRLHRWRRISGDIVNSVGATLLSEVKKALFGEDARLFTQIEPGTYLRRCNFKHFSYAPGNADHLKQYQWQKGNTAWKENFKNNFKNNAETRNECFPFVKYSNKDEVEVLPIRIQGGRKFNILVNKYLRSKVNKNMMLMNDQLYLYPEGGERHKRGEPFVHGKKFVNVFAKRVFGEFNDAPRCGWSALPQNTHMDFRVDADNALFIASNLPRNRWEQDEQSKLWFLTITIVRAVNWKPKEYKWRSHSTGVFERMRGTIAVEVKTVRVVTEQRFDDFKWQYRDNYDDIVSIDEGKVTYLHRYAAEQYGMDIGEHFTETRMSRGYERAIEAGLGNARMTRKRIAYENTSPEDRKTSNTMYVFGERRCRKQLKYDTDKTVSRGDFVYLDLTRNNMQVVGDYSKEKQSESLSV